MELLVNTCVEEDINVLYTTCPPLKPPIAYMVWSYITWESGQIFIFPSKALLGTGFLYDMMCVLHKSAVVFAKSGFSPVAICVGEGEVQNRLGVECA